MSNLDNTLGGSDVQSVPDIAEKQAKLEKLGIQIESSILARIEDDHDGSKVFSADIIALENNPIEKTRFEHLYLNGYGQTVDTPFGTLSFAQIQKHPKKDEILASIKPSKQARYNEWEEQTANQNNQAKLQVEQASNQNNQAKLQVEQASNQEGKAIDARIQASNQKLEELDKNLAFTITELESINGVPKPTTEELQKRAKDIPELQGANPADIQSGKYNNILLADYYERNATEISRNISNPQDQEKFKQSLTNIRTLLGRRESFDNLTKSITLGSGREQIESRGRELIEKGYSSQVLWNPDNRTITFTHPNGDTRIIETTRVPPRELIVKNGLSIGQDIPPIDVEEQKKKEKQEILTQRQGDTRLSEKNYADMIQNENYRNNYTELRKKENIQKLVQAKEQMSQEYGQLNKTEAKRDMIQKMIITVDQINEERKKDGDLLSNMRLENTLETEKFALQDISRNLSLELQAEQDLPKGNPNKKGDTQFESNAAYNLNFLSYVGYDSLGQDNMERIIRALNNPANPKRSEIGEINLNQKLDTPKTQALTLAIANLVRGGRTENDGKTKTPDEEKHETSQKTWDNVDKTDPIIAARQTQSLGFRESLISVRRNMTQEGGSLKTNSQLERVLYGKNSDEGINNSAINTVTGSDSGTSFA